MKQIVTTGGIPIPPALLKYRTSIPNAGEWIDQVFWHSRLYPALGTGSLDFFTVTDPSLFVTNMEAPGQMAGDKEFLVRAIGVEIFQNAALVPATDPADFDSLSDLGVARLYIGNKDYSEWPVYLLTAGGGVAGYQTNPAAAAALVNNGVADPRAVYSLAKPLLIPRQLNFKVRVEWPTAPALTTALYVRVSLRGEITRQIQ